MRWLLLIITLVLAVEARAATEIIRYVNTASAGGDGTTNNLSGATAAFADINTALTTSAKDAVAADEIWRFKCSGTAADTSISNYSFASWTLDATRYIQIETDSALANSRHPGYWSASHYRIEDSTSNTATFLTGSSTKSYIRFVGIQFKKVQSSATGSKTTFFAQNYTCDVRFRDCIFWSSNTGAGGSSRGILLSRNGAGTVHIQNNLFFGQDTTANAGGVFFTAAPTTACYIVNNTFVGEKGIVLVGNASEKIYNNIFQCNTTGYTVASGVGQDENYNLGKLAAELGGANSQNSVTLTFINAAGGNYHLAASDTQAIDTGYDIYTSQPTWWWGDEIDIDENARSGTWDLGMDEYQATTGKVDDLMLLGVGR